MELRRAHIHVVHTTTICSIESQQLVRSRSHGPMSSSSRLTCNRQTAGYKSSVFSSPWTLPALLSAFLALFSAQDYFAVCQYFYISPRCGLFKLRTKKMFIASFLHPLFWIVTDVPHFTYPKPLLAYDMKLQLMPYIVRLVIKQTLDDLC